jgi:hypothetical protein
LDKLLAGLNLLNAHDLTPFFDVEVPSSFSAAFLSVIPHLVISLPYAFVKLYLVVL